MPELASPSATPAGRALTVLLFVLLNFGLFALNLSIVFTPGAPTALTPSAMAIGSMAGCLLAQSLLLWWRDAHPTAVFTVGSVLYLTSFVVMPAEVVSLTPSFYFLLFSYSSRAEHGTRHTVTVGAAAVATVVTTILTIPLHHPATPTDVVLPLVISTELRVFIPYALIIGFGTWYGTQQDRSELLALNAQLVENEHQARVEAALTRERNHMARELHDVAAHHLTTIMVHSKALLRKKDRNSQDADEMLKIIEGESSHAVRNMSAIVGILRQHRDVGEQPQLSKLPDLLDSLDTLDPGVSVTTSGDLETVDPQVSLACYRIVQESVTNARKYAPGAPITVTIARAKHQLTAEVRNAPPQEESDAFPPGSGLGILGMQERVTLLGGELTTGRTDEGGWFTHAVLPTENERSLR